MSDTPRHGFRKLYPKNSLEYKSFISKKENILVGYDLKVRSVTRNF
jgi:hypothetical protein